MPPRNAQVRSEENRDFNSKTYEQEELVCVVHSRHPLTFGTIQRALSAHPAFPCSIRSYGSTLRPAKSGKREILVLDTCSIEGWHKELEEWHLQEGRVIALVAPEMEGNNDVCELLYMGVGGILSFSEDLDTRLPSAMSVVARGGLWVKRGVLDEYVKRTSHFLRYLSSGDRLVTTREGEIIDLLREGFSNKQIANTLQISERTVKFHVSNVLRKCEIESRRELRAKPCKSDLASVPNIVGSKNGTTISF